MEENTSLPAASQKVLLTINSWKSKLLDLSKRNRALNFKPNKVSTITIIDEQATEIFNLLCLQKKSLKFKPKLETPEETERRKVRELAAKSKATDSLLESPVALIVGETAIEIPEPGNLDEDSFVAPDFVPYESNNLADQYTDDFLQTNAYAEKLDTSLRRLEELARSSLEEQGVNSLFLALGMLQYADSSDSKEFYKAPLILVPVALERRSARTGYVVKTTEDEPIVNPSLAEYLRRNFNIALPEIPDAGSSAEEYSPQTFFSQVTEAIKHQPNWTVKNEIQLALFSFQKLVMYKDLEKNAEALAAHSMINKVITRTGDHFAALPDEVRSMELDRDFAPEATAQVVDADSSQLRAIAAVARDYDLVLEGPPGTGKSQTITNLIAQSLSAGKSVLFVAEKMAALDVVYRRLVAAGLGEFCLELHSTKANKRTVMDEIRMALDSSLQAVAAPQESTNRLPGIRGELTAYTNAVHTKYGTLDQSPYAAYGELGAVLSAPKVLLSGDVFSYTQQQIKDALRHSNDLNAALVQVGSPGRHPWRETTKTFYSEYELDSIQKLSGDLIHKLDAVIDQSKKIETSLGLPPVVTFADVQTAVSIAGVMARSPGAPMGVLNNQAWNSPPAEAVNLIEKARWIQELKARIEQKFTGAVFDQDPAEDITYIERKSSGFSVFWHFSTVVTARLKTGG